MNTITKSVFAAAAMTALAQTRRSSRIVGYGDPPVRPHYQNGWRLEILKTESTMPAEVRTRLAILKKKGVAVRHVLIAHELPKQPKQLEIPREVVKAAQAVLPVLGAILGALAAVFGMAVTALAAIFVQLLGSDPVVIVVLEDKTWLEICRWQA